MTARSGRGKPSRPTSQTARAGLLERLQSPVAEYYMLLGTTTVLVVFGLIMVLSASSVKGIIDPRIGSAYGVFIKQSLFALLGLVAAFAATRISVGWWKRLSFVAFLGAVGLQCAVFLPGIGREIGGNRNWIGIGSFTLQPSELVKLALVMLGATMLANKRRLLGQWRHAIFPYLMPAAVVAIALVLAGKDLGTGLVLFGIVASVLFVAGVPGRLFALGSVLIAGATAAMVVISPNRMERITNWLSPACSSDPDGKCGQSVHGLYALADGGWWGVGLGGSREKWAWLAEPHNDFIFAIIGEELGLPGTIVILALFAVMAFACYRIILRSTDQFVRIATGGVMGWIIIQTMINIGAVIGLLPVIGVPLPLVSAGGSSLTTTLLALGMVMSFARRLPGAEPMFKGSGRARRVFAIRPLPRRGS